MSFCGGEGQILLKWLCRLFRYYTQSTFSMDSLYKREKKFTHSSTQPLHIQTQIRNFVAGGRAGAQLHILLNKRLFCYSLDTKTTFLRCMWPHPSHSHTVPNLGTYEGAMYYRAMCKLILPSVKWKEINNKFYDPTDPKETIQKQTQIIFLFIFCDLIFLYQNFLKSSAQFRTFPTPEKFVGEKIRQSSESCQACKNVNGLELLQSATLSY